MSQQSTINTNIQQDTTSVNTNLNTTPINIDDNQTETETEIMQDSININYDNITNQKKDNDICETMTETVTESFSNLKNYNADTSDEDEQKFRYDDPELDLGISGINEDLTGNFGVIKNIISEGTGWDNPNDYDEVYFEYKTVEEIEWKQKKIFIQDTNEEEVFSIALSTMKENEISTFKCKPKYYSINNNSTITLEIKLIRWYNVENVVRDGSITKMILRKGKGWDIPSQYDLVTIKAIICNKDVYFEMILI